MYLKQIAPAILGKIFFWHNENQTITCPATRSLQASKNFRNKSCKWLDKTK